MTPPVSTDVERGRGQFRDRAWDDAYESLARADDVQPLEIDDLERLAWSAALTGRDPEFLRGLERIYQTHLGCGRETAAARAAFWICFRLFAIGEAGRAGGWFARSQKLADAHDCVERGYLMMPSVHRHMAEGDNAAAIALAIQAAAIGDRFRDADLTAFARGMQGRARLRQGEIDLGLALFDEAMVAATSGELTSPVIVGLIYCSAIAGCQRVFALGRAREWTSALAAWCDGQPQLVTFSGTCLVHRAEILQLGGAWGEAIEETHRAARRAPLAHDVAGEAEAAYQRAELHRLQGALVEAEEAYQRAGQLGLEPQPGLALLRMAQGRRADAAGGLRRVLGATTEDLRRVRLLPAQVEIQLALGARDDAERACAELEEIAARLAAACGGSGAGAADSVAILGALAAEPRGMLQLASGEPQAALLSLRRAFQVWQRLAAPYLAARVRVRVAEACRALDDQDGCRLELECAREVFVRLGATPDVARVDAIAQAKSAGAPAGLTPRELEVLRLLASGRTNKAIAKQLFLSEKTIDRHVSNIFTKIDVASRAAATAFAYQHQLV
jgi:DNA-binding CsgD family transcriptional regulator